ncbi:unnamed protein product [Mytilus edulis]|uniref:B box-type domain-containing protein n=1 Tax=Mytilus edulis TaxID=6550 RepID=A0A8S3VKV3_MYTED|nr:unnamed protein product [Mytilus edulis]
MNQMRKDALFCQDCIKPVCSFCVIEPEHKGHNIDKLSTVYSNQLAELRDIKERIENYSDLTESVKECTSTSDNYNEIKEKIIQRERELKEKVSEEAAVIIGELDKLIIPSKDAFMEVKLKFQEKESTVKKTNKLINEALQSHQANYILETIGKVDKHLQLNVNADNIPLVQKFALTVPPSLGINFGSVKECPILRTILIGFQGYSCGYSKEKLDIGVMILDKKGNYSETLWIKEKDSDCQKISSIDSLTSNTNGDIIICAQHGLSVFDSKFNFKWTNQTITSPNDLVTTPTGLIAVSSNTSVHLLSMEGKHLKSIGKEEENVDFVLSFLPICQLFDFTKKLQEDIFSSLRREYSDKPQTWDAIAKQCLYTTPYTDENEAKFHDVYEEALREKVIPKGRRHLHKVF